MIIIYIFFSYLCLYNLSHSHNHREMFKQDYVNVVSLLLFHGVIPPKQNIFGTLQQINAIRSDFLLFLDGPCSFLFFIFFGGGFVMVRGNGAILQHVKQLSTVNSLRMPEQLQAWGHLCIFKVYLFFLFSWGTSTSRQSLENIMLNIFFLGFLPLQISINPFTPLLKVKLC